jgi:HEAT repeat protein
MTFERTLERVIGNDPIIASEAVGEAAESVQAGSVAEFVRNRSSQILGSPTALVNVGKLFGRLGEAGAAAIVDCIRLGDWETKRIAAQSCRYVDEPAARTLVEAAMLHYLDAYEKDHIRAAIRALGELGTVLAASRVMEVARRNDNHTYDLYAIECLTRLVAADKSDLVLGSHFSKIHDLVVPPRNTTAGLSRMHFIFPEWKGRVRDTVVDLVCHQWVGSDEPCLQELGADALQTLRLGRTRGILARRIQELAGNSAAAGYLALALGVIGATDDTSVEALQRWLDDERLRDVARLAIGFSFPQLKTAGGKWARVLQQFALDVLKHPHWDITSYVILGLGRRHQMTSTIRGALSSENWLVRAGATLALAWSEGTKAEQELREFVDDAHESSFERLIGMAALAQLDPGASDQLYGSMCNIPPLTLWYWRHGVNPTFVNPYFWMREIVFALSTGENGGQRARAWAEVLLLDADRCIVERMRDEPELQPAKRPLSPAAGVPLVLSTGDRQEHRQRATAASSPGGTQHLPRMPETLYNLLLDLFRSNDDLVGLLTNYPYSQADNLVAALPGPNVPRTAFTMQAVQQLQAHGLDREQFFDTLAERFPARSDLIQVVKRTYLGDGSGL